MRNNYTKFFIAFIFSVLAFMYGGEIQAQTYPVQTNVYIMPPYGKHLNDYYTTSKEKLVVSLLNRDQQKPVLEVRLRMTITASNGLKLQSKEEVNYPTITLDANIPTRLTQDDLAPYFQYINAQGYLDQGKLPDGMVEFTFQVIEKYTGKVLSAPATGRIWLSTQKPPLLRLPSRDDAVGFRDPMNLKFQWEPQHKNLSQIEYEFELRELPDNGAASQSAFMYAPIIHQERTIYTYLIYDVMMPPLDPNKRYGWRVRAIAKDGVDELNMFDNNGYSEIFWFRTQTNCLAPTSLSVDLQNRQLNIKWLPEIGNNEFVIQYRPKYGTSEEWREVRTYDANTSIYDMQRGTVYEYRVGAICTTAQPIFTNTGEVTIPAVDSTRLANCGVPPQLDLENKERLPELKVGDRVMLSDYPMTVTKVSGANGNFSGEGWVPVNWLLETKWAVSFSNITVNTDYKLIAGSVRAKYDEKEGNIANIDHITEGGSDATRNGIIRPDITLEFSIPENPNFSYNEETGQLMIYTVDGQEVGSTTLPKSNEGKVVFPVTVKDKDGNIYKVDDKDKDGNPITDGNGNPAVDENGNPQLESTYLGKQTEPLDANSFDRKNINTDVAVVTFTKGAGYYAFDTWLKEYESISKFKDKYDHLAMAKEKYHVPWKLLPVGKTDVVKATIEINKNFRDSKDKPLNPKNVIFTTEQGTLFEAEFIDNNEYKINLLSGAEDDVQEIYALYPVNGSSEKFYTLGRLNVIGYRQQTHKLKIVPVIKAEFNEQALIDKLKEIYGPVGVTWEVSFDHRFNYEGELTEFFDQGKELLSAYNPKMNNLQEAYKEYNTGLDKETACVFLLSDSGDGKNRDTQGFMPLGKQFGYIFLDNIKKYNKKEDVNQIIAHELGHGIWKLSHTFDKTYGAKIAQNDKINLMSYGGGTHLARWQWDVMNEPAWFSNPLDGDEKGKINVSDSKFLGFTEDGYVVKVDLSKIPSNFHIKGYFIESLIYKDVVYKWNKESKSFVNNLDTYLNLSSQKEITGEVAIWHPTYKSDCFFLYQNIDIKNYTPTKESFADLYKKIELLDKDINSRWIPDLKKGKSEDQECLDLYYSFFSVDPKSNSKFFDLDGFRVPKAFGEKLVDDTTDNIEKDIINAANKLNTLISKNRASYLNKLKGDTNLDFGTIYVDENIPVDGGFLRLLDFKLSYLSEYSKQKGKETNFYVVYQNVNRIITGDWNEYARKVYAQSNLKSDNASNILIVIPYLEYQYKTSGSVKNSVLKYFMPGMYASNTDIDVSQVTKRSLKKDRNEEYLLFDANNELGLTYYLTIPVADTYAFIYELYKYTAKPQKMHIGYQYPDGSISYTTKESEIFEKGNDYCKKILALRHKGFYEIEKLTKPVQSTTHVSTTGVPITYMNDRYELELLQYQLKYASICDNAKDDNAEDWEVLDENNGLIFKEDRIDHYAKNYIEVYAFESGFGQWLIELDANRRDLTPVKLVYNTDHTVNRDALSALDPVITTTVDIVGIPLSFVGADAITDGIGLAYSVMRGNTTDATIYSASLLLVGVNAGVLKVAAGSVETISKGGLNFVRFGGKLFVQAADGTFRMVGTKSANRVLKEFFNVSKATDGELTRFIHLLDQGNVTNSQIKAIIGEADEAKRLELFKNLGNTANLLPEISKAKIILKEKLGADYSKLIADFGEESVDLLKFVDNGKVNDELVDAWKILKEAKRTGLCRNIAAIEALNNIRKNTTLRNLGFTDELLSTVHASRLPDGDYVTILNDLDKFGNKLATTSNTEFVNFKNIIGKLTDNNPQNSQAAHWIIQDITNNMGDFAGKKWDIEFPVRNSDGNASFIDVASNSIPPKFIEYKWLTSVTVGKDDFIREFIKRDLFNSSITNLSQLEWRIKGQKLTKEKVLEYMNSVEGRKALNNEKIIKLFDDYAEQIGSSQNIKNVEDIINFINKDNSWYLLIFK
ncbi:hypothetical protein [Bacteroides reticulotermitis]|uniref:hypothetical protein n=1 Tax=Bacteroides reticulotermitis TaxID=1133319 RepID=UPI003A875217